MNTTTTSLYQPTPAGIHRSRFGYHSCSYETFTKLRFLKKHYWKCVAMYYTWLRQWHRKTVNRCKTEPAFPKHFVINKPCAVKQGKKEPYRIVYFPHTLSDFSLLEMHEQARMPKSTEAEVILLTERQISYINTMYDELSKAE